MSGNKIYTGNCLCGGVHYEVNGPLRDIINCFCEQCKKTSGHYVAATSAKKTDLKIINDDTLSWYDSSPGYQRGFCHRCGGNLFWHNTESDVISIMAGTLDTPTGLKTVENIFTESASDYCAIPTISKSTSDATNRDQ